MTQNWLLFFSLAGFWVSWYIYVKKKKSEPLVCFIGKDCNQVVRSKYNHMFGIPNEVVGMVYYAATAAGVLLLWNGFTAIFGISVWGALVAAGGIAAVSSLILLAVQAFVLRQWCDYCIASALITLAIFGLEIF
jgi:uncharacterized membrane protein